MVRFFQAIREGLRDILSHKFRSFLTMLGIVLGVSALQTMFAITAGMTYGMREELNETGGNLKMVVEATEPPRSQQAYKEISQGQRYEDALALRNASPLIAWVAPIVELGVRLEYQAKRSGTSLKGVDENFLVMDRMEVAHGRYLTDLDQELKNRVCVLGAGVAEEFWPRPEDGLGEKIRINGEMFTVVGIFKKYESEQLRRARVSGQTAKMDERRAERGGARRRGWRWDPFRWKNHLIAVPLTTTLAVFRSAVGTEQLPDEKLSRMHVGVYRTETLDTAVEQVRNVLLARHRQIEDFSIRTEMENIRQAERQVRTTRLQGALVAGISLVVGGLGITNIMLASIVDRIREIGLRFAVGATPSDIFVQLLVESVMLACLGGILGLGLAVGLVDGLDQVANLPFPPIVEYDTFAISFVFALVTGFVAGIYPAWKASSLSPLEALRFD